MSRKILPMILLISFGIFSILVFFNYSLKNINKNNGFERKFITNELLTKDKIPLQKESYSIINVSSGAINLYKFRKPYSIISIWEKAAKIKAYQLPYLDNETKFNGLNSVAFFNKTCLVLSGITSMAYKIDLLANTIKSSRLDDLPFYQSESITANSFILTSKVVIYKENRRKLKKVNWEGKEISSYFPEKQTDGYFSNDGQFRYDRNSNRLVYMLYYKGAFTCLDTNLNVLYQANTIDTLKHPKIKLKLVGDRITQSTPPPIVNKRLCVANGRIYINSNLKSDNQKNNDFLSSEVIDVYDLKNGKYFISFNLPKIENQRLTEFKVYENKLFALYNYTLVCFEIPTF
jgi:hypothetical protein